jgi:endonuclease YncB( thermonuclease family)
MLSMKLWVPFLFASLLGPAALAAAETKHRWERWDGCTLVADQFHDGDSFQVRHGRAVKVLRLYSADAPETDSGYGARIDEQSEYFGVTPAEILRGGGKAKEFTATFLAKPFTVFTRRTIA